MEIPKKSLVQSNKIVDIASQQEHQLGRNASRFTTEDNGRPSNSEQPSNELIQQRSEQEKYRQQLKATTILDDKSEQIVQMQQEIDGLNSELRLRSAKISILEQEHRLSQDRIHQLMMDNHESKQQSDNQGIQHELDEQKITNGVLKHHCSRLSSGNEQLEKSLKDCRNELSQALVTIEQHYKQLCEIQNSHTEQVSIIAQQRVVIARQESDLKHASLHYYGGVINHDREPNLSINLPEKR